MWRSVALCFKCNFLDIETVSNRSIFVSRVTNPAGFTDENWACGDPASDMKWGGNMVGSVACLRCFVILRSLVVEFGTHWREPGERSRGTLGALSGENAAATNVSYFE
jgi:hypothetical protein